MENALSKHEELSLHTHDYRSIFFVLPFAAMLAVCGCAGSSSGGQRTGDSSAGWATYGGTRENIRFSTLSEITSRNIADLQVAYVFQTGIADAFETNPLEEKGMLFLTAAHDVTFAIDATTGQRIWEYEPHLSEGRLCCGPVNRGIALGAGLVYVGLLDGRLVALDEQTGKVKWVTQVADSSRGYSITAAPLFSKSTVYIGAAGSEFGIRGFLDAYNASNGRRKWRWYSTDASHWMGNFVSRTPDGALLHRDLPLEKRTFNRYRDAWRRGGAAVWMTPAIDESNDTIFLTTGNPWPDYSGRSRPGDNLYSDCIVALDAGTGNLKWYFQEVPHDMWDWDASSPPFLLTATGKDGKPIEAVAEAGKTGWLYVLDRATGRLIRRSDAFVQQKNMFMPPSRAGQEVLPGPGGGSNWSPVSYIPELHIAIVTASEVATKFYSGHLSGTADDALGSMPANVTRNPATGSITAIDVDTGHLVWKDNSDRALIGGSLSTAGALTFVGESNGYFDALSTRNGQLLWQFQTGAGVNAPPVAFSVDGKEYIAVASGGSRRVSTHLGDALFVFRLR